MVITWQIQGRDRTVTLTENHIHAEWQLERGRSVIATCTYDEVEVLGQYLQANQQRLLATPMPTLSAQQLASQRESVGMQQLLADTLVPSAQQFIAAYEQLHSDGNAPPLAITGGQFQVSYQPPTMGEALGVLQLVTLDGQVVMTCVDGDYATGQGLTSPLVAQMTNALQMGAQCLQMNRQQQQAPTTLSPKPRDWGRD